MPVDMQSTDCFGDLYLVSLLALKLSVRDCNLPQLQQ